MPEASGLEKLSEDAFFELFTRTVKNPQLLEIEIQETAKRGGHTEEALEDVLAQFVHESLAELMLRFDQLFALFWDDPERSRNDFASLVSDFLQHQAQFGLWEEPKPPEEPAVLVPDVKPEPVAEPEWPWPIAVPPAVDGASYPELQAQHSGLWLCGYRVGRIYGLPDEERRRFLDHFFLSPLPSVVAHFHGDSYGAPGSRERLLKMANVIAARCRNFRRNDARRYWIAIQQWDQDLRYLKETYGQRMPIVWPGAL